MNYPKIVRREDFPVDQQRVSGEALERSAGSVAGLRDFVEADPFDLRAERMMPQMGRLLVGATWPHMEVAGRDRYACYEDGQAAVPDMEMTRRFTNGGSVTVKPYLGESRVLVRVHQSAEDTTGVLHAGFPYAENQDFFTDGSCFVKDNRLGPNGPFYDSANEGFRAMVEPTQAVVRVVLQAID